MIWVRFIAYSIAPLLSVALLGWDGRQVLVLYWMENVVAGILAVIAILRSTTIDNPNNGARITLAGMPTSGMSAMKRHSALMFVLIYGIFVAAHGFFVFRIISSSGYGQSLNSDVIVQLYASALPYVAITGLIQVIFSLVGTLKYSSVAENFGQPFLRMFVLHVVILGTGGFVMSAVGASAAVHENQW